MLLGPSFEWYIGTNYNSQHEFLEPNYEGKRFVRLIPGLKACCDMTFTRVFTGLRFVFEATMLATQPWVIPR